MSIQQVEEYYLYLESSKFNLVKVIDMCDDAGLDFTNQDGSFVVETFYSEYDAEQFLSDLSNEAGVKS